MSVTTRRRVTSYDVAQAAGVAQSTVSRCFQEDSGISPDTRARVVGLAAELGYAPNALARSLITRRSGVVGVVATSLTLRSNPDVVHAISDSLTRAGKRLLLITVPQDWPSPEALRGAHEFPLDGMISCVKLDEGDVRRLLGRGVAVVFFNRTYDLPGADVVVTEHAEAARDVAARLFRAGHRRFFCIAGPDGAPVSDARISGFMGQLAELGINQVPCAVSDFSYAAGRAAFVEHAGRSAIPFDAVFCASDQLALGALDGARHDMGYDVPNDVSIIGFDDIPEACRPTNNLTTVHQDSEGMARTAVDLLLARIVDSDRPERRIGVAGVLVVRGSARLA